MAQCNVLRNYAPEFLFYGEYTYLLNTHVRRADRSFRLETNNYSSCVYECNIGTLDTHDTIVIQKNYI